MSFSPIEGILTPLTAYHLLCQNSRKNNYTFRAITRGDELHLLTDAICFVVSNPNTEVFDTWSFASQFLHVLRAVSGQAHIPTGWALPITSGGFIETDTLPVPAHPTHEAGSPGAMPWGDYLWQSAVTRDDIITAEQHLIQNDLPSYKLVLVDAIRAAIDFDPQKCILYSAFAMESAARFVIDRAVQQRNNNLGIAVDPVYEHLRTSSTFRIWLHPLAHYAIGRSLHAENKTLYDQALRLYEARSKFAHAGSLQSQQNEFANTPEGALDALQCLKGVLDWFDEGQRYAMPTLDPLLAEVFDL